jgi:hypothetical protein
MDLYEYFYLGHMIDLKKSAESIRKNLVALLLLSGLQKHQHPKRKREQLES